MTDDGLLGAIASAPPDIKAWLQTQASLASAWSTCERADWLFWLARRRATDERQRRNLVGAATVAILMSDAPTVRSGELLVADAWSRTDLDDNDPTGYRATIIALCLAGAVGIAIESWLYFRHDNPIRGPGREIYSVPPFLALTVIIRLIARPWLKRRWASRVRRYSFERAEKNVFPLLAEAVERTGERRRAELARLFRERMAWTTP